MHGHHETKQTCITCQPSDSPVDFGFMVQDGGGSADTIQIEVGVLSQVDRRGSICGGCHVDLQLIVCCQQVSYTCD